MSMNMRLINISMFYNYLLNATNNIFILYPASVKVIMSTRTDQYDTIQNHVSVPGCKSPCPFRTTAHQYPFKFLESAHAPSALSPPLAHPLAHLASPRAPRAGTGRRLSADGTRRRLRFRAPQSCVYKRTTSWKYWTKGMSLEQASEHWPQPISHK